MRAPIVSPRSLLASLFLASVACCSAGDGTAPLSSPGPPPLPPPPALPALAGDLVVQVAPALVDGDISVGFSVTVVGQGINVFRSARSATTVRLSGLEPGSYTIELALLDEGTLPKCTIRSDSRRIADVVAGTTTSVYFSIDCSLR